MTGGTTPPPPDDRPTGGQPGYGAGGWETPPPSPPPPSGRDGPGWTGRGPGQSGPGPGWGGRQSGGGMDANVASGLSYVLTFVTGVIFLVVDRRPEVRFHAWQAVIFGIAWLVVAILRQVLDVFPLNVILWLAWLGGLVTWVVLMVQGFQGNHFKLPYIGDLAEQQAGKTS
jgi:uncharacterized membrane protein